MTDQDLERVMLNWVHKYYAKHKLTLTFVLRAIQHLEKASVVFPARPSVIKICFTDKPSLLDFFPAKNQIR